MQVSLPYSYSEGMKEVHYGIIGMGQHAFQSHALPAETLPELSLTAVCDSSQERLDMCRGQFGNIEQYKDRKKFLESSIGAVLIGTPDEMHYSNMLASLGAGKHVFVEKPLAIEPDEVEGLHALLTEHAEKGQVISSCHPRRFDPPFMWLKNNLPGLKTEFGAPLDLTFDFSYAKPSKTWKHDRGLLLDHANHEMDLLNYLFGHSSFEANRLTDSYDRYQIAGIRDDNIAFHFSGTRKLDEKEYLEWARIRFEKGEIVVDTHNGTARIDDHDKNRARELRISPTDYQERGRATMANFIGAIVGRETCYLSTDDLYVNTATSVMLTSQTTWRYDHGNTTRG